MICSGFSAVIASLNFWPGVIWLEISRSTQEVLDPVTLFVKLFQRRVHPFPAEIGDLDALDDLVLAALAGHRVAVYHALGNAIAAVGGNAHRHPFAARAGDPVADMVDGGVGCARGRRQPA